MDAKEYNARRKELNDLITQSKRELAQIRNQYIEEHCPYRLGDKVHIIVPSYIMQKWPNKGEVVPEREFNAYVCQEITIDEDGVCWPTLHKEKKNGEESIQYEYLDRDSKPIITKIES